MYSYGHYGVVKDDGGKPSSFDELSDLQYHPDIYEVIKALCLVSDDSHAADQSNVPTDHRENHAALWNAHKATMRRNQAYPYQQIVAPDGRIYWWMRLV